MPCLTPAQRQTLAATGCDLRDDHLSRVLYATDASMYRVEPAAVAVPRTSAEVAAVLRAATETDIEVIPRGAGTGLAGGAIGAGLVVDLAHHSRWIADLDLERRTVRVGAGVVLDQLNDFLRPHGLCFGPDVATASRATLGGMISNNSSGAHAPVYGTTNDHLLGLEMVLTDGSVVAAEELNSRLTEIRVAADRIVGGCADEIKTRFHGHLDKRWPGYALDHYLASESDLVRLICGSEGTLALITAAELGVVPLPQQRGLAVLFFASVADAMQATVELLDLEPAAVEHLDAAVFDQTRGQLAFASARALLELDEKPAEALLLVEFFDQVDERLAEVQKRRLGIRSLLCRDRHQQELVWAMRRAGLSLVTSRPGPAKPAAGIEDVCVRPQDLPAYVAGLQEILEPLGLEASFYGHSASGELHVRPVIDLHTVQGVAALRQVGDQVSALCRQHAGSLTGEHGVGLARTEYLAEHLGPRLSAANRQIKQLFDPRSLLNPGKIVDTGRYRIDNDLRLGEDSNLDLPFEPVFAFVEKDHSLVGNLEQCNGCGGCRKDSNTMCPTFAASGEELMSTRGRANVIRAALEGRFGDRRLAVAELEAALDACLGCKACKRECPSGVDLAMLKAELKHAGHQLDGVPLVDRVIAAADLIGRLGSILPGFANWVLARRWLRALSARFLGFDHNRPLPPFAGQRFDRWFAARDATASGQRGTVVLWDDTWTRYHEPGVGRAAVRVLEAAGYRVMLAEGRKCCGRPACSRGLLDEVQRLAEHNVKLLQGLAGGAPVVFLEPSCHAMFVDEYRNLELAGAERVAERCVLFEDLILDLLEGEPETLPVRHSGLRAAVHGHCHSKALGDPARLQRLGELLPSTVLEVLDTGCCGMAGAFGMFEANQELSKRVAEPLVHAVEALEQGTEMVASGTSCRHQIEHLTGRKPKHFAELLAEALE